MVDIAHINESVLQEDEPGGPPLRIEAWFIKTVRYLYN
jgi:hypothetical protein